jgi:nucleotide-binding universal stress UspA family protein
MKTKAKATKNVLRIQSILVPTDFSPPSLKALRYAEDLAGQYGAKLILLNVIEPIGPTPDFAYNPMVLDNAAIVASAQKNLKKFAAKEGLDGVSTYVRQGVPYHEISRAATELKADLICLATHGYTGLKHVFMGSTAERVVRHAPCPVLVVRQDK